jgi:hypothetical protein
MTEEVERSPIIDLSDLKMEEDLSHPAVKEVMIEFGRRIWKRGRASTLDQIVIELRGRNLHEAADLVAKMRES